MLIHKKKKVVNGEGIKLTSIERQTEGWPDNSVTRNVARLYALIAQDIRSGTRSAPSFRDAVALHELIDTTEHSAERSTPQ